MGKQLRTCAAMSIAALVISGWISWAFAAPPTPVVSERAARPEQLTLICDTGELGPELAARLHARLFAELAAALAHDGLGLGETPEPTRPQLRIEVVAFDEERRDYELRLELSSGAQARTLPVIACEACSERRLVALLVETSVNLIAAATEVEPPRERPAIVETLPPAPTTVDSPDSRRLSGLGVAGAVMLGVGVTACATGSYLWVRGVERHSEPDSAQNDTIDFRPAGATTLALGAIVASVGVALLSNDLQRRRGKARRAVALELSPTFFGIRVQHQF